ncbi:MAG: BrxE family protein [bacterium]|nr:BrxE family protein [bacterium]
MSQRIPVILKLTRLRFLVGALGERVGWWPSRFTDEIGLRQLSRLFPRTALRAAFESVSIAARRDHDDDARPIPPASIHLFRLGPVQEDTIAHHLAQGSAQLKVPPTTAEEILAELDELGPPDQAPPPVGPCSLGKEQRVRKNAAVKDLARVYAAAARSVQRAIPFFEVIR